MVDPHSIKDIAYYCTVIYLGAGTAIAAACDCYHSIKKYISERNSHKDVNQKESGLENKINNSDGSKAKIFKR